MALSSISVSFVRQFEVIIISLVQQRRSKLRSSVMGGTFTGKSFSEDFLRDPDKFLPQVVSRHQDTVLSELEHSRRTAFLRNYARAYMIDSEDNIQMLADPTSNYVREIIGQFNRTVDITILEALLGDALGGENGEILVPLPFAQKVPVGGENLTLSKLKDALKIFMANDVDLEEHEIVTCLNAAGYNALLEDVEAVNKDFITGQPNETGRLGMLVGTRIIQNQRINDITAVPNSETDRPAVMYAMRGGRFRTAEDMRVSVKERADKLDNIQILLKTGFAATRLDDKLVVEIRYDETA